MRRRLFLFWLLLITSWPASAELFYPGCYASSDVLGKSTSFRINRRGKILDLFPLQIPQGHSVNIQFPAPIRWDKETNIHLAHGSFTVKLQSAEGKSYLCRYPVKLEANFLPQGEEVDITLTFSQRYSLSPRLRCLAEGEAQTFYMFYRKGSC
jgi:hypothetical protein